MTVRRLLERTSGKDKNGNGSEGAAPPLPEVAMDPHVSAQAAVKAAAQGDPSPHALDRDEQAVMSLLRETLEQAAEQATNTASRRRKKAGG